MDSVMTSEQMVTRAMDEQYAKDEVRKRTARKNLKLYRVNQVLSCGMYDDFKIVGVVHAKNGRDAIDRLIRAAENYRRYFDLKESRVPAGKYYIATCTTRKELNAERDALVQEHQRKMEALDWEKTENWAVTYNTLEGLELA